MKELFGSPCNYGGGGALCFDPGMGVTFREDGNTIDLVVCLECSWIEFYVNEIRVNSIPISRVGSVALRQAYEKLFPAE